jgi:16S rRNA (guanine527-N7)-methyltransferase
VTGPAPAIFGARLPVAQRYEQLLATDGITRGLIGPRERDRLWDRHLLNCAVLTELLPPGADLVDVGSGAGLPGLVIAIRRPDVQVQLLEPLERRTKFLVEAIDFLGLGAQVTVVRGRAGDPSIKKMLHGASYVSARAVAPLDRLVGWCMPLLRPGGALLAIKGETAAQEISSHSAAVQGLGGQPPELVLCGQADLADPVRVVVVRRG